MTNRELAKVAQVDAFLKNKFIRRSGDDFSRFIGYCLVVKVIIRLSLTLIWLS